MDKESHQSFQCHTRPRVTPIQVARRAWRRTAAAEICTPSIFTSLEKCHHASLQRELAHVTGPHQRPQWSIQSPGSWQGKAVSSIVWQFDKYSTSMTNN